MFLLFNVVGWTITELGLAPIVIEAVKGLSYVLYLLGFTM